MRDDERGPAPHQEGQALLDEGLGLGVEGGRGLVQDEDPRIRDERPREAEKLALAERQVAALLLEHGVVAVRKLDDEVMRPHGARGPLDLRLRRAGRPVADVLEHGAGEQEGILQHHGDVPAEGALRVVAHVAAVDHNRAGGDIVEAVQQRRDAGLAGPGRAHQRHRLARRHLEAHVVQHRVVLRIAEGDVAELDGAPDRRRVGGAGAVGDGERHVEHLEDALARRHRALHHAVLDGQRADRVEEPLHVEQEGDHHADREAAVEHLRAAEEHDDAHRGAGQGIDRGHHDLRVFRGLEMGLQVLARLVVVEIEIDRLAAHALDGAHGVNALGERAVGDRIGLARPAEGFPRPRQPDHADQEERRHDRQGDDTELEIERQHDDDDADQQHQVAEHGDRVLQEFLQRVHVALEAGHHAPDLRLVHEGERDMLQVGEHGVSQVEDDLLASDRDQAVLHPGRGVVHDDDGREDRDRQQQGRSAAGAEQGAVDAVAHGQRDRELRARRDEHRRDGEQHASAVRPHIVDEAAHDAAVEHPPEHLLVAADLRADDGARRAAARPVALHCAASPAPSSRRVCKACSAA